MDEAGEATIFGFIGFGFFEATIVNPETGEALAKEP